LLSGLSNAFAVDVKCFNKMSAWGWPMKLQNIFRTHVVVMGFAATFLLAGGARTQEIDNTVWADSSNVESFPQPTPAVFANELSTVATNAAQTETALAIAQPDVSNEAVISGGTTTETWLIAMSIMLMAPLGLFVLAKVRRTKQNVDGRAYDRKDGVALS
jgi:hypothetical protein